MDLNSLKVECTLFFQENPHTFETMNGLSIKLGRDVEEIRPIIESLVTKSILEIMGQGENAIYRYRQPDMKWNNEG